MQAERGRNTPIYIPSVWIKKEIPAGTGHGGTSINHAMFSRQRCSGKVVGWHKKSYRRLVRYYIIIIARRRVEKPFRRRPRGTTTRAFSSTRRSLVIRWWIRRGGGVGDFPPPKFGPFFTYNSNILLDCRPIPHAVARDKLNAHGFTPPPILTRK